MESKTIVLKMELDITEAEKALDKFLKKTKKTEDTLKRCEILSGITVTFGGTENMQE